MNIATELTRIQQAKSDIKTAIEAKGVTVPSSATIDIYDDYVSQISGGGGESWITPIPQSSYTATTFDPRAAIMSVDIPSGVTSIGYNAFSYYENLTRVTIPNSVTSFDNFAFLNCSSLPSVIIPDSVTSIGNYAFQGCSSLTSVTIPSSVTNIAIAAFEDCVSLTSVTIPNSVTTLGGGVFYRCSGLTNCTIGTGVTSIGSSAFLNCSGLTGVTIEAVTPPTLGNNAFNNTNDCPIYVPSGSVETYKSASNWSTYASRIQAIT